MRESLIIAFEIEQSSNSGLRKAILCFLLCFIIFFSTSNGQQYNFTNISTNQGLPSSECYGLFNDHHGYIWIRTLNGIARFNGRQFTLFNQKNGLKDNAVYAFCEDDEGKIWFATASAFVGYIWQDSVHYLPCSASLAKENGFGQNIIYKIITDRKQNVFLSTKTKSYKINKERNYNDYEVLTQPDYFFQIAEIDGKGFCIPDTNLLVLNNKNTAILKLLIDDKVVSILWNLATERGGIVRNIYDVKSKNGDHFFNLNNWLYCVNENGELSFFHAEKFIYNLFIDRNNNLWVGLNSGGVMVFKNGDLHQAPKYLLENASVSCISQDFEDGIWLSTLNNGLYYCKNLDNENFTSMPNFGIKPEMLKIIDSQLFISDFESNLMKLDLAKPEASWSLFDFGKNQMGFLDIDRYKDGYLLSGRSVLLKVTDKFDSQFLVPYNKARTLTQGSYNTILVGNEIYGVSKDYMTNFTSGNVYHIPSYGTDLLAFDHRIFISTRTGLYYLKKDSILSFPLDAAIHPLVNLFNLKSSMVAVAKDGLIFQIEPGGEIKQSKIETNLVNHATVFQDRFILLATASGIIIFDPESKTSQRFTTDDGLLDNEIFKVASYQETIYYSTIHGLARFFPFNLKHEGYPARMVFLGAKVNQSLPFVSGKSYPAHSSLSFLFDLISFKYFRAPELIYKLEGYDHAWNSILSGQIQYSNLNPGKYRLLVAVRNGHGLKSPFQVYEFQIEKPFYQTWWFFVCLILAAALLVYFTIRGIIAFISKRESEKTRINKLLAEYQLMGFKAQLNPHFIFNCLNSIQNYVLNHDSKAAYTYMAKFSKLIRIVLDHSDKNMISLEEDLDLIKLYVELEQLRFKNRFDFLIQIEEDIEISQITLPAMFIQLYVENAIWHGLMNLPKDSQGKLVIHVFRRDNLIVIEVVDNGVGRVQALKFRTKSHDSKGISINDKRIEAINHLLKSREIKVEIIDLYDELQRPDGTKVVIKLTENEDEN